MVAQKSIGLKQRITHQPQDFTQEQMQGFSLLSNHASAIAITNRLTGSQFRLWHYLMMIDPFADQTTEGERIYHNIPSPVQIGVAIGANPKTIEKDMKRLEKLDLYAKRINSWQGYNLTAEQARTASAAMKQAKESSQSTPVKQLSKKLVKRLKPLQDKTRYLAPETRYLAPETRYLAPETRYLAEGKIAEKQTQQPFQASAISLQSIQIFSEESREEVLLKNFEEEEEGTRQSSAALEVKPEPVGKEPRISGEDQPSAAAAPTEIKSVLGSLFSGSTSSGGDCSRQRERPRSIPQGYFEDVMEILGKHQRQLERLGIDLGNENLQETINAYPHNLEPAIEAFFERCAKGAIDHPERYLNAAVRGGWQPRNKTANSGLPKSALTPEFLEAYEQLCECGFAEPLAPEHLPVVSNVVNVRVRTSNPRPFDPLFQSIPWTEALSKATAAGLLPDIGDDDW